MSRLVAFVLAVSLVLSVSHATAALVWDVGATANDGVITGGNGVWDLLPENTVWATDQSGATNTAWTSGSDAEFRVADAGSNVVTIDGAIEANSITFFSTAPGYTLAAGTGALELTGAASLVVNADATVNAPIFGSAGLNKSGSATLVLGGTNFFSGGIALSGGKLQFSNDNQLGATAVTQTIALSNDAELAYTGGNVTLDATRVLSVATAQRGILYTATNMTLGSAGQLTGGGMLEKTGAGNLILSQANTGFTGTATVTAGTLQLNVAGSAGSAKVALNGGALRLQNDASTTFGNNVEVTANSEIVVARSSSGTGSIDHTLGSLSIGDQTLRVSFSNCTGGTSGVTIGAVTLTGNPTFDFLSASGVTSNHKFGSINDGGQIRTITKTGGSRVILTGAGSFTTGTQFNWNAGSLRLTNANALNGAILNVNSTSSFDLRANSATTFNLASINLNSDSTFNVQNNGSGSNQTLTVAAPIVVTGNRTLTTTNNNGYSLTLGDFALQGDLEFNAGLTTRPQSITEDGTPRKVTKNGSGLLNLQGAASTYSGGTFVLNGGIQVSKSLAAGTGTIYLVDATGAASPYVRAGSTAGTVANPIVVRSGSTGTMTIGRDTSTTSAGDPTFSGPITLERDVQLENSG